MPDEDRGIEEENLIGLLTAALRQPVAGGVAAGPGIRWRWRPRVLAAAAAVLVVVLGAMWLVPSEPEASAPGHLPALRLPFPQLLAESLRKLDDIDTVAVTFRAMRAGEEEVTHAYYKRPSRWYEELSENKVLLDDGTRSLTLDLRQRKVLEVRPSAVASRPISALVHLDQLKAVWEQEGVELAGPFRDTIDGTACQRYDFEVTMLARPQIEVPERTVTGSCWFSLESGLIQRMENKSESDSFAGRAEFQYNVPVDAAVFRTPDWANLPDQPR